MYEADFGHLNLGLADYISYGQWLCKLAPPTQKKK